MPTQQQIKAAARILSSVGASKGGFARAKSLTSERRHEIAVQAYAARKDKRIQRGTTVLAAEGRDED